MYTSPVMYPAAPPASRKRRLWPWFAGAGACLFIAGAFVFAFWVTAGDDEPVVHSTQLHLAHNACGVGDLADGEHTMIIDTQGEEYGSGSASFADALCVLNELGIPQSVLAQMEQTRALDGMQDAEWDSFGASWTYHPDDGLDLIITESSGK